MTFLQFIRGINIMSQQRYSLTLHGKIVQTKDAEGRKTAEGEEGFFECLPVIYHNLPYAGVCQIEEILNRHIDAAKKELLGLGAKVAAEQAKE